MKKIEEKATIYKMIYETNYLSRIFFENKHKNPTIFKSENIGGKKIYLLNKEILDNFFLSMNF